MMRPGTIYRSMHVQRLARTSRGADSLEWSIRAVAIPLTVISAIGFIGTLWAGGGQLGAIFPAWANAGVKWGFAAFFLGGLVLCIVSRKRSF